ncbi:MAG TPA: hypothetical protein VGN26_02755 [Armatimonadota bacterium]
MRPTVEFLHGVDHSQAAIRVDRSDPGIVFLVANQNGMAWLADLCFDLAMSPDDPDFDYVLTEEIVPGSPKLRLAFNSRFDEPSSED